MYYKFKDQEKADYLYSGYSGTLVGLPYDDDKTLLEKDNFKELLKYENELSTGTLIINSKESKGRIYENLIKSGLLAGRFNLVIINKRDFSKNSYESLISELKSLEERGIFINNIYLYIDELKSFRLMKDFLLNSKFKFIAKLNSLNDYRSHYEIIKEAERLSFIIFELPYKAEYDIETIYDFILENDLSYYFFSNLYNNRRNRSEKKDFIKGYVKKYFSLLSKNRNIFDLYLINIIKKLHFGPHLFYEKSDNFGYSYYKKERLYLNSPLLLNQTFTHKVAEGEFELNNSFYKDSCINCYARFLCEIANSNYNFFIYNQKEDSDNIKECSLIKLTIQSTMEHYLEYYKSLSTFADNIHYYHPVL